MRQMSKNIKNRSNSVNCLQQTVSFERKNRLEITLQQDRLPIKNHANFFSMFSLLNQCLTIKKDFMNLSASLSIVYEINDKPDDPSLSPLTIKDEIKFARKPQKLTLHLKKLDMVIIKNQTKHFHSISPEFTANDLLIDLKISNKIISIQVQNQQSSKKIEIDLVKLPSIIQSGYEGYNVINPLQFIEQGIKLRASKMQSAGKIKKIVWGENSAQRIGSAKVRNSLPELENLQEASLTPFNDNFQSFCSKKLDFSKQPPKDGMLGQLEKQMDKELLNQIGKKLKAEPKESLLKKINETKNKTFHMPPKQQKSKLDCTLKEKNMISDPKQVGLQKIQKKSHSRQLSDQSKKHLQNFFNNDTQKFKQKKKSISYKTDMSSLGGFFKSVKLIDSAKRADNKENEIIHQKNLVTKKRINQTKKIAPSSSFGGVAMIKSIRTRTEANN